MAFDPTTLFDLLKETVGFVRDITDPTKREKAYRLNLEKKAKKAIVYAGEMDDIALKLCTRLEVMIDIIEDSGMLDKATIDFEDDIDEIKKTIKAYRKYSKRFGKYR